MLIFLCLVADKGKFRMLHDVNEQIYRAFRDLTPAPHETIAFHLQMLHPEVLVAPVLFDIPKDLAGWWQTVISILNSHNLTSPSLLDALFNPLESFEPMDPKLWRTADVIECGATLLSYMYGVFLPTIISGHMERYYRQMLATTSLEAESTNDPAAVKEMSNESDFVEEFRFLLARSTRLWFEAGRPLYIGTHPEHIDYWQPRHLHAPPTLSYKGGRNYVYSYGDPIEADSHQEALIKARIIYFQRWS